ncbi:MAG: metal ABC transporter solute-binding protein, Zn/Mn family, partial [Bacillota bacterium]
MKKISIAILMVIMMFGLAACQTNDDDNNKVNVVTSLFPQYDVARALGEDNVNLTYILPPGVSAHSYEPTASTIIDIL